jgi:hypothetical protein
MHLTHIGRRSRSVPTAGRAKLKCWGRGGRHRLGAWHGGDPQNAKAGGVLKAEIEDKSTHDQVAGAADRRAQAMARVCPKSERNLVCPSVTGLPMHRR